MRSTADRRCKILLILCERRTETIGNLSFELRLIEAQFSAISKY